MSKDEFGDRMKELERVETSRRFDVSLPVYARIDGRSFSKFTKGMNRPFDEDMSHAMQETTIYLMEQSNAIAGYTQSDEISLLFHTDNPEGQIFFDGKVMKMTSVLAGLASVKFSSMASYNWPQKSHLLPVFDARVFQMPSKMEAANAFLWRELDAAKNAISMAARHHFSHKQLNGKTGAEMKEMMNDIGVNFNDYPLSFRRGTFFVRKEEWCKTPEEYVNEHNNQRSYVRKRIVSMNFEAFSAVRNRVEFLFNGEQV